MDPVIIRAYQLKVKDKFKRQGIVYEVIKIDADSVYYKTPNEESKSINGNGVHTFGAVSHEMIELIERSNYNE